MQSSISIPKETKGKLTVQLHVLSLQLFDQTKSDPNTYNSDSKMCMSNVWRE